MSDHAGDSREQAIAAAIHALGVDKDLKASPSFTDWAAKKVLDAAHREGHIFWADEYWAAQARCVQLEALEDVQQQAIEENERLQAAIREIDAAVAVWNETGEHFHIFKVVQRLVAGALGDGAEAPDVR